MYPSLTQLNEERESRGLSRFPDIGAVRDAFDEACDVARRHEAERMRALEMERAAA